VLSTSFRLIWLGMILWSRIQFLVLGIASVCVSRLCSLMILMLCCVSLLTKLVWLCCVFLIYIMLLNSSLLLLFGVSCWWVRFGV